MDDMDDRVGERARPNKTDNTTATAQITSCDAINENSDSRELASRSATAPTGASGDVVSWEIAGLTAAKAEEVGFDFVRFLRSVAVI